MGGKQSLNNFLLKNKKVSRFSKCFFVHPKIEVNFTQSVSLVVNYLIRESQISTLLQLFTLLYLLDEANLNLTTFT